MRAVHGVAIQDLISGHRLNRIVQACRAAGKGRREIEYLAGTLILVLALPVAGQEPMLILDDRSSNDLIASSGTRWRLLTDGVMGGVSTGTLEPDEVDGRPCLRLRGEVRLENNGGFVQAALDLGADGALDASTYEGLQIEVYGNGESYNLHLRTRGLRFPWQAYRASFEAGREWRSLRLPFETFEPYRTSTPLDTSRLVRLGVVAIGRAFEADLCISAAALYRHGD